MEDRAFFKIVRSYQGEASGYVVEDWKRQAPYRIGKP